MAKPISTLESLPAEAQAQIISWLEVDSRRTVLKRIAQDPPEGLGLKTHLTTLTRFYNRHVMKERAADLELARSLAPDGATDPIDGATQTLTREWAFQIATKPKRDLKAFRALSRWILEQRANDQRDREIELLERRLAFDRERYEVDIAQQVLRHYAELDRVAQDRTADDQTRINQARAILFNRPVEELPR
jgi:hypothetical protein